MPSLRKLDPPSHRRIMRSCGATFAALPGETPEPRPTPATHGPMSALASKPK